MKLDNALAEKLKTLQNVPEWKDFADLALYAMEQWRNQLTKFSINDSCEQIAKERIKWTSQIHGVESLFQEVDKLIKQLNEKEEEEEDDDRE